MARKTSFVRCFRTLAICEAPACRVKFAPLVFGGAERPLPEVHFEPPRPRGHPPARTDRPSNHTFARAREPHPQQCPQPPQSTNRMASRRRLGLRCDGLVRLSSERVPDRSTAPRSNSGHPRVLGWQASRVPTEYSSRGCTASVCCRPLRPVNLKPLQYITRHIALGLPPQVDARDAETLHLARLDLKPSSDLLCRKDLVRCRRMHHRAFLMVRRTRSLIPSGSCVTSASGRAFIRFQYAWVAMLNTGRTPDLEPYRALSVVLAPGPRVF